METIIYRHGGHGGHGAIPVTPETSDREAPAWQPDMFYPAMSTAELDTWTHWLPTSLVFTRSGHRIPWIDKTLMRLQAPPEVLEEYRWSVALELFDTYEIRTPERRELRDPLLIGRCGSQRYRVALWGESLRPFEEITALVQESLRYRQRATRWRRLVLGSGVLLGLAFGLWIGGQPTYEGSQLGAGILVALMGFLFTGILVHTYSPETQQQNFLDRYR